MRNLIGWNLNRTVQAASGGCREKAVFNWDQGQYMVARTELNDQLTWVNFEKQSGKILV